MQQHRSERDACHILFSIHILFAVTLLNALLNVERLPVALMFLLLCTAGRRPSGFEALNGRMCEAEKGTGLPRANRMFFLSIPPNVFIAASAGAAKACRHEALRLGFTLCCARRCTSLVLPLVIRPRQQAYDAINHCLAPRALAYLVCT